MPCLETLYGFVRQCEPSSHFFIRSLQKSDASHKSSFFLHCLTLLYDGDQLQLLLARLRSWIWSRRFLGDIEVGFLTALGVRVGHKSPTPKVHLNHFLHRTPKLGILTRAC